MNEILWLKELRRYLGFMSVDAINAHIQAGQLPHPCNGRRPTEIGAVWDQDAVDRFLSAASQGGNGTSKDAARDDTR